MTVQALLGGKTIEVKTIGPSIRIETAAALLRENRIGAFPVVDPDGKLVGILSERDIITAIATRGADGLMLKVDEVMTRNVVTVTMQDTIKDVMSTMTTRRIRHLPVLEAGRLKSVISIGDVIKFRINAAELEMNVLRDYALAKN
ncbi:MAG: CBS domain-containing protein [Alphaproteobacteria bacterium]|nr:CBS domain-containing protein [Alphaproteobacteria bacterium]